MDDDNNVAARRTVRVIARDARRQSEVADRVGISRPYVSQIGRHGRPIGSTACLARFAAGYAMSGDDVLETLREWFPEAFADGSEAAA